MPFVLRFVNYLIMETPNQTGIEIEKLSEGTGMILKRSPNGWRLSGDR